MEQGANIFIVDNPIIGITTVIAILSLTAIIYAAAIPFAAILSITAFTAFIIINIILIMTLGRSAGTCTLRAGAQRARPGARTGQRRERPTPCSAAPHIPRGEWGRTIGK